MLRDLPSDLRYALRGLIKTPGFTCGIVLTLALGIGANTAIFSAIDAILLRPAMVENSDTLVQVYTASADGRSRFATSSYPDYVDLRDEGPFAGLAAFAPIGLALDVNNTTTGIVAQIVSGNYFDVLGVQIAHGRGFLPEEDRVGAAAHVVVVADAAWQKYFAGDPMLVGRQVSLNGNQYTVVGIAPRGFTGVVLGQSPQAWVPMALQPEVRPPSAGVRRSLGTSNMLSARLGWHSMVGRLPLGTPREAAISAADVIARRLEAAFPDSNRGRRFNLVPLSEGPGVRIASRPLLRALGAAVGLVLLIACANVAGLLIVRAIGRQKEIAVRLAIGASRFRLVRQWLIESLLLGLLAAAAGTLLALWTTPLLYQVGIPEGIDLSINTRVLVFTLIVAIASAVVFGCASAIQVLDEDPAAALREEGRGGTTSARATRLRSGFIVLQVALSLVLLVGAGLFLRTLQNAYAVDLGYHVDRTLLADVTLDMRGYSPESGQRAYADMLDRIGGIPGVAAVGAARVVMLSGSERRARVSVDGQPLERDGGNGLDVRTNVISHGYLDTLGISLLRGRDFGPVDRTGSPRVAIVSRSLAGRLWPNADPIGKTLVSAASSFEVIGVVPDVVYENPLETEPPPFFYSLLAQNYESGMTLYVRTVADPMEALAAIQQAVRQVDPHLALWTPVRLREVLNRALGAQRMMAQLVSLFGAIAVALAVIGLYGLMAHSVVQRRTEIGVRLALGAGRHSILMLILGQGLRLILLGLPIGALAALGAAYYLRSHLFGVEPADPATLVSVCVLFIVIGVSACMVPARRALNIDPIVALKQG